MSVQFRCFQVWLCQIEDSNMSQEKKGEWKRKIDESSITERAKEKESRNNEGGLKKGIRRYREWNLGTEPNVKGGSGRSGYFDVLSSLFKIGPNIKIYLRISRKHEQNRIRFALPAGGMKTRSRRMPDPGRKSSHSLTENTVLLFVCFSKQLLGPHLHSHSNSLNRHSE
jgi:hypothetical protein